MNTHTSVYMAQLTGMPRVDEDNASEFYSRVVEVTVAQGETELPSPSWVKAGLPFSHDPATNMIDLMDEEAYVDFMRRCFNHQVEKNNLNCWRQIYDNTL